MKKIVIIVFALILNFGLVAQTREVVKEEFYSNGNLKLQFISVSNKLVEATYFFENGEVYETGYYLNQKLTGNWLAFDTDANLQTSAYFFENKKVGVWNYYKIGVLSEQVLYSESVLAEM